MLHNIIIKSDFNHVRTLDNNQENVLSNKQVDHLISVNEESIINENVFFCLNTNNIKSSSQQGFIMHDLETAMIKNNFTNVCLMRLIKIYMHKCHENISIYISEDNNGFSYYNLYSIIQTVIEELVNNKLNISKSNQFKSDLVLYLICMGLIKDRIEKEFKYADYKENNLEHQLEQAILCYLSGEKQLHQNNYKDVCDKIVNKYSPKLEELLKTNILVSPEDHFNDNYYDDSSEKTSNQSVWSYVFVLLGIGSGGAAVVMNNSRKKLANKKKSGKKVTIKLKKK